MRLRWTLSAAADMQQISDYLKEHHPRYRQPTMRKLYERIRSLKQRPHLGKRGRVEGTRELLLLPLPYIIVYRLSGQTVEILRIYHGAQEWS